MKESLCSQHNQRATDCFELHIPKPPVVYRTIKEVTVTYNDGTSETFNVDNGFHRSQTRLLHIGKKPTVTTHDIRCQVFSG